MCVRHVHEWVKCVRACVHACVRHVRHVRASCACVTCPSASSECMRAFVHVSRACIACVHPCMRASVLHHVHGMHPCERASVRASITCVACMRPASRVSHVCVACVACVHACERARMRPCVRRVHASRACVTRVHHARGSCLCAHAHKRACACVHMRARAEAEGVELPSGLAVAAVGPLAELVPPLAWLCKQPSPVGRWHAPMEGMQVVPVVAADLSRWTLMKGASRL